MSFALTQDVLLPAKMPLKQALAAIDARAVGAAVVVDAEGRMEGLLVDAHFRRSLAANPGADWPELPDVIQRQPPALSIDASPVAVAQLMRDRNERYVVALDRLHRPAGLFTAQAIPGAGASVREAVIMAGGLGSRLRPFTYNVPKPLLMVNERPILEIIIGHLHRFGIRKVYLAVNYHSDKIQSYFQNGQNHDIQIEYLEEREALGTAGALRLLPQRPETSFLVMNADLLTGLNVATFCDVHELERAALTTALVPHRIEIPYGVAKNEGMNLVELREKPTHTVWINGGIYVLRPEALDKIPPTGPADMPSLINSLIKDGHKVAAYPMRESWLDIGQIQDYQRAVRDVVSPSVGQGG